MEWITAAIKYVWGAVAAHPFNASTLVLAFVALIISLRALSASRAQAKAARDQADEAKRSRELNERALAAQAEALKSQSDQAAEMMRHVERSATAAERSAEAAQSTALSSMEVQRAALTIRHVEGLAPDANRVPRAARVFLVNTGKATALDVHLHQRMEICATFPTALPIPETWSTVQPTNIGAGVEQPLYIEGPVLPAMAEVWDGRRFMCVYGMAKYEDFLGARTLGWCYAWDVRQEIWYAAGSLNKVT